MRPLVRAARSPVVVGLVYWSVAIAFAFVYSGMPASFYQSDIIRTDFDSVLSGARRIETAMNASIETTLNPSGIAKRFDLHAPSSFASVDYDDVTGLVTLSISVHGWDRPVPPVILCGELGNDPACDRKRRSLTVHGEIVAGDCRVLDGQCGITLRNVTNSDTGESFTPGQRGAIFLTAEDVFTSPDLTVVRTTKTVADAAADLT
jgi:hypothetical protein